jgi:hypothetical protein
VFEALVVLALGLTLVAILAGRAVVRKTHMGVALTALAVVVFIAAYPAFVVAVLLVATNPGVAGVALGVVAVTVAAAVAGDVGSRRAGGERAEAASGCLVLVGVVAIMVLLAFAAYGLWFFVLHDPPALYQ